MLPYDVALVGNDDIALVSFLSPRFTTIGVPKLRMGRKGAELLIERIRAMHDFTGIRGHAVPWIGCGTVQNGISRSEVLGWNIY